MVKIYNNKKGFLSIIGLIAALIIVLLLGYLFFNTLVFDFFLKKGPSDEQGQGSQSDSDLYPGTYQSVIDTSRSTIKTKDKQRLDLDKQLRRMR